MIWPLGEIFCGILILIFAILANKEHHQIKNITSKFYWILLFVMFFIYVFLLIYKITEIPIALNLDEAGIAYDARSIAQYHCDRFLYRFPVLFRNFGGGGLSSLYIYSAALFVKILGYSTFAVRLPSILFSLISTLILVLSIQKIYSETVSLYVMFCFCVLPFSIMHSRWGLEAYLMFPMFIISVVFFNHTIQAGKTVWYFICGCVFGITLYTYTISYLIIPFFLAILLIYLAVIRKLSWKNLIVMGIPLFLFALPLILMLLINYGFIDEIRTRFFSIPKISDFRGGEIGVHNIISNLRFDKSNIFYRLFADDGHFYNVIPKFGTMYYFGIPILIYGFLLVLKKSIKTVKQNDVSFELIIIVLFFVEFLISLLLEGTNVNKMNGIYFPLIFFLVMGIHSIAEKSRVVFAVLGVIYLICFVMFANYYFTDFSKDMSGDVLFTSIEDFSNALTFAESVSEKDKLIYILDPLERSWSYVYVLLAKQIDPYTFNKTMEVAYDGYIKIVGKYRFRLDAYMPDHVYIFLSENLIPGNIDEYGFFEKRFGKLIVFYPGRSVTF